MEKQDLSKVLITDSKFYVKNAPYIKFFQRHNYTTIDQIIDGTFHYCSFNGHKMKGHTASTLNSFIGLIRYEYLGEPLVTDAYLDRSIDLEETSFWVERNNMVVFKSNNDSDNSAHIRSFFGCDIGNAAFNTFIGRVNERNRRLAEEGIQTPDVKMIDFFKWILTEGKEFGFLNRFAETYIKEYEKDNILLEDDSKAILILKNQLDSLYKMRNDIDIQITDLKKKIDELSNKDSKGGMGI